MFKKVLKNLSFVLAGMVVTAVLLLLSAWATSTVTSHITGSTGSTTTSTSRIKNGSSCAYPMTKNLLNVSSHIPRYMSNVKLDSSNAVELYGVIDDGSVNNLITALQHLNSSGSGPIYLIIDSPGGNVLSGFQLLTAMQSSRRPVYTICHELCASMAAYTFEFGKKRLITNRSILMFHDAYGRLSGNIRQSLTFLQLLNHMLNKVDAHVARVSHQNLGDFQSVVQAKNLWLDAQSSVKYGFADNVTLYTMSSSDSVPVITSVGDKVKTLVTDSSKKDENVSKMLKNIKM